MSSTPPDRATSRFATSASPSAATSTSEPSSLIEPPPRRVRAYVSVRPHPRTRGRTHGKTQMSTAANLLTRRRHGPVWIPPVARRWPERFRPPRIRTIPIGHAVGDRPDRRSCPRCSWRTSPLVAPAGCPARSVDRGVRLCRPCRDAQADEQQCEHGRGVTSHRGAPIRRGRRRTEPAPTIASRRLGEIFIELVDDITREAVGFGYVTRRFVGRFFKLLQICSTFSGLGRFGGWFGHDAFLRVI
jgi:hypothetical protein